MDHGMLLYSHRSLFFLSLPSRWKARAKNTAGKKMPSVLHSLFSTAQCTRQKHPLNIGVYGSRRRENARVKPPCSFDHLSAFAAYSFYPSLPPIDFSRFGFSFFHRVAAFPSISDERIVTLSSPLFRSYPLCLRHLASRGRFSASLRPA